MDEALEKAFISKELELRESGALEPQITAISETRWQPGQSGNPGGRPKHDLSAKLARIVLETEPAKWEVALRKCALTALGKGDIKPWKVLAERGYGKLPQPLEHSGHDGGAIEIIFSADKPKWLK